MCALLPSQSWARKAGATVGPAWRWEWVGTQPCSGMGEQVEVSALALTVGGMDVFHRLMTQFLVSSSVWAHPWGWSVTDSLP